MHLSPGWRTYQLLNYFVWMSRLYSRRRCITGHRTHQFHRPRQMQVKAAQDSSCPPCCILRLPFAVQRKKKAFLTVTLKSCRELTTWLVLSCQETDDCRLPNITCWEGKKQTVLLHPTRLQVGSILCLLAIKSTGECSLHLKRWSDGCCGFRWLYSLVCIRLFNEENLSSESATLWSVLGQFWVFTISSSIRITCCSVSWKPAYVHMDPCLVSTVDTSLPV